MSIERTATAICDVCADEEVMGTRPFDEIPDGWAWLDLIGKRVMLLCPICAGTVDNGGWPDGDEPGAIEQAAALAMLRMREAREALEALARVQDDERRALADEYGGFADGEETA